MITERYASGVEQEALEASGFVCRALGGGCYLLTYDLVQGGRRRTRRATVWERVGEGWRIVYHQGTVVEDVALTVGEDCFAAGGGEGADGGEGGEVVAAGGGDVGHEEDAAGAGQSWRRVASSSKMGGASGQKLPNQGPLTRPLTRWTGWRV